MTHPSSTLARPAWLRAALAAACVVVLGLALAPTAHAQNRAQRQAAEAAEKAREAFTEGNFAEAAGLLQQAFDFYPEPNFVWNQARAYELGALFREAEDTYMRFSRLEVSGEERQAALDRAAALGAWRTAPDVIAQAQDGAELELLRATMARMEDGGAPSPVQSDGLGIGTLELAGYATAGLGVIALGAVGTLQLASIGTVEEYHAAAAAGETNKYTALKDTLNTRVVVSQVLLGTGIALAGTGATLLYFAWFAEGGESAAPASTGIFTPFATDDTVGVGYLGRF